VIDLEDIILNSIANNGFSAILVFWLLFEGRKSLHELTNSIKDLSRNVLALEKRIDIIENKLYRNQ